MDNTKPWKVVKIPTAYGIVHGIKGEVLMEAASMGEAQTMAYQWNLDDTSPDKFLLYAYDCTFYDGKGT